MTELDKILQRATKIREVSFYQTTSQSIFQERIAPNGTIKLARVLANVSKRHVGHIPKIVFSDKSLCFKDSDQRFVIHIDERYLSISSAPRDNFDITFGVFLHEMAHAIYTFEDKSFLLRDLTQLQKSVMNIVEDRRIEAKLIDENPGYRWFLTKLRAYHSLNTNEDLFDDKLIADFMFAEDVTFLIVTTHILYPDVYDRLKNEVYSLDYSTRNVEIKRTFEEAERFFAKTPDYLSMNVRGSFQYTQEIINELFKNTSKTICTQVQQHAVPNDRQMVGFDPEADQIIFADKSTKDLKNAKSVKDLINLIFKYPNNEVKDVEDNINKLLNPTEEESVNVIDMVIPYHTRSTMPSEAQLIASREISDTLKRNFLIASSTASHVRRAYGLSEGELDENMLASVKFDRDVFTDKVPGKSLNLEIIIAMDASGSMRDIRINEQAIATYGILSAFSKLRGVTIKAYAHTANIEGVRDLCISEIYKGNGPVNPSKVFGVTGDRQNADGFAYKHIATKFSKRKAHKLLIAIADGLPEANGYKGKPAINHTAKVVRQLEAQGIQVLSIPVGSAFSEVSQKQMFSTYIPYKSTSTVGEQLKNYLINMLKQSVR